MPFVTCESRSEIGPGRAGCPGKHQWEEHPDHHWLPHPTGSVDCKIVLPRAVSAQNANLDTSKVGTRTISVRMFGTCGICNTVVSIEMCMPDGSKSAFGSNA